LASFFGLHLMPTVIVFVASLPILVALTEGAHPVGPLDAVAVVVCLGATALEAVADEQLRTFRKTCTDPKRIHDTGLWGVVRHPNYLGEMLFWWGVYLFALAADLGAWWTGIGALLVTCLFLFASIPLIETRMRARRPGWDDHVRRVPALLPWPRRT
jgi:steroid 5-alpha reductase family enzyme